jgi:hypothetical protein
MTTRVTVENRGPETVIVKEYARPMSNAGAHWYRTMTKAAELAPGVRRDFTVHQHQEIRITEWNAVAARE